MLEQRGAINGTKSLKVNHLGLIKRDLGGDQEQENVASLTRPFKHDPHVKTTLAEAGCPTVQLRNAKKPKQFFSNKIEINGLIRKGV